MKWRCPGTGRVRGGAWSIDARRREMTHCETDGLLGSLCHARGRFAEQASSAGRKQPRRGYLLVLVL
jgi:hypothetical protein